MASGCRIHKTARIKNHFRAKNSLKLRRNGTGAAPEGRLGRADQTQHRPGRPCAHLIHQNQGHVPSLRCLLAETSRPQGCHGLPRPAVWGLSLHVVRMPRTRQPARPTPRCRWARHRGVTAGRGRPWQPCGRDVSASRHLRLGTRPWFGCMRCAQGRPGRCCVWSARPSRPSGAAPVPFRRSFSDFWLENDFLFWPFYVSC